MGTAESIKTIAVQETRHSYAAEGRGKVKMNTEGVSRGGPYKWYYGTGSKPEDVEKMVKEREMKGRASRELYETACEHGGVAFLIQVKLEYVSETTKSLIDERDAATAVGNAWPRNKKGNKSKSNCE